MFRKAFALHEAGIVVFHHDQGKPFVGELAEYPVRSIAGRLDDYMKFIEKSDVVPYEGLDDVRFVADHGQADQSLHTGIRQWR